MKYNVQYDLELKHNNYGGKFIALEGIDGSGKTTQIAKLSEYLKAAGKDVLVTKEPTREDQVGELIHDILQSSIQIPSLALQYLFVADRIIHYEKTIIPALKVGKIVLTDRCLWSSIPYGLADKDLKGLNSSGPSGGSTSGEVEPLFQNSIRSSETELQLAAFSILSMYEQIIVPDATIYIDVPVEVVVERLSKKQEKEIYENKENLAKIALGYKWLINNFSKEFTVIDGTRSIEEVNKDITSKIYDLRITT